MREPLHYDEDSSYTRRAVVAGAVTAGLALALPDLGLAAPALRKGGRLRSGHVGGGTAETLMPHNLAGYIDAARAQNLYDGLTAFGPTNKLEYRLAESMEPNARGDQWQIKLRQGVTFHNGKELTADDVLYTWRYMLNPKNVDYLAPTMTGVLDPKRSKKIDKHTVLAQLVDPVGYLPEAMALPWQTAIFPSGATTNQLNHKPNGTGPFKFVSWTQGQRSLFKKNENYWVTGKPYVDELEMISIPDSTARLNALLGGEVDMIESPAFSQVKAQASNPALKLLRKRGTGWVAFFMRLNQQPFTDKRVVAAFKLAIDRQRTVVLADLGYSTVGNDVYGKGFSSYAPPPVQHVYDPEKAKALLKQAGHADGVNIDLFTSTAAPGMQESAQAYAQQAKAAGINVNLRSIAADSYYNSALYYLKQPFYQTYWNSGSFEAITRLSVLKTAGTNETAWNRPAFDAAFKRASAILDPAKRRQAMAPLQELIANEGGYIIWSFIDSADLTSKKVNGIAAHPNAPLGNYDFRSAWLSG